MAIHCTRVYFTLRKNRPDKNGYIPIVMSLATNKQRCYIRTGKKVQLADWSTEREEMKGRSKEAESLNSYLNELRNQVYQKEVQLMEHGYVVTVDLLKEALENNIDALAEKTLMQVLSEHNVAKKQLVGKSLAPATYWVYEYTEKILKEYMQEQYKRTDLTLKEINLGFIQGFHTFLLTKKNMSQNSCSKHLKFLKAIINYAVANNYIVYNLVNAYKIERTPVEMDYLDEDELRRIINFETPLPRLERARDMFLFGCFTGLSYIDIKTLSEEHFERDDAGRIWIKKKRVKTGILSRIPLLPMAKMILEKYKGGSCILPIQDAADVNKYLKDIAILTHINKRITFHTSRHTFATTVTLSNNISLEVVSKMLGHTNTRMTSHYAKLIDKCIGEQMDKLTNIFTDTTDKKQSIALEQVGGILN